MDRWTRCAVLALAACAGAGSAAAQDMEQQLRDQQARTQIQTIVRDRPPQAEAAARAFVYTIAPNRFGPAGEGPVPVPILDQLKTANLSAYWMEVAQLTVQFEMFQQVMQRDSARARQTAVLFGTEFEARALQRGWRGASEAERRTMRGQLEALMTRHFEAEDQLRALEVQDIERRVAEARAETERRRARRAELVRRAVDDIIEGANDPTPQGAGGAAAPCFILAVTDFAGAVAAASGLSGLPPYIALGDAALGPRGRRLLLPPVWQHASPYVDWAWWRNNGAQLVLSFRGPRGTVEVALRRAGSGYIGEVVTPLPRGIRPAQIMLEPSSCEGMTGPAR